MAVSCSWINERTITGLMYESEHAWYKYKYTHIEEKKEHKVTLSRIERMNLKNKCASELNKLYVLYRDCDPEISIWFYISQHKYLSDDFIIRYNHYLHWANISYSQKLSERMIEKFKNKVVWKLIWEYQRVSIKFIEKFIDKVDWYLISQFQKLNQKFIAKYEKYIEDCYLNDQTLKHQKYSFQL